MGLGYIDEIYMKFMIRHCEDEKKASILGPKPQENFGLFKFNFLPLFSDPLD
jgi:hypothetical protein